MDMEKAIENARNCLRRNIDRRPDIYLRSARRCYGSRRYAYVIKFAFSGVITPRTVFLNDEGKVEKIIRNWI